MSSQSEFDWLSLASTGENNTRSDIATAIAITDSARHVRERECLTVNQARLLLLLAANGPCATATDAAHLLNRTLPTTLVTLKQLERLGLLERCGSAGCKGQKIDLSTNGRAAAARLIRWHQEPAQPRPAD